jgi:DNA-binding transcriptional LysR family regulator
MLEVRSLAARSTELILADGVDVAFGVFDDLPSSINQQQLFRDEFVCVVRADPILFSARAEGRRQGVEPRSNPLHPNSKPCSPHPTVALACAAHSEPHPTPPNRT